jgi:hypothetical protein
MAITNSTLFSESFSEVETFLKSITDPRGRFKPHWVHSSMPHINQKGYDGYPFMILTIDVSEENKSFDVTTSNKFFRVLVRIYATEPTHIDSISDEIANDLKDQTKLTDFDAREISSSPINWAMDEHGKKVLFRSIGFILKRRI